MTEAEKKETQQEAKTTTTTTTTTITVTTTALPNSSTEITFCPTPELQHTHYYTSY
jgi:uncharacterized protein YfaS (alpha-2-macroglobulin family)